MSNEERPDGSSGRPDRRGNGRRGPFGGPRKSGRPGPRRRGAGRSRGHAGPPGGGARGGPSGPGRGRGAGATRLAADRAAARPEDPSAPSAATGPAGGAARTGTRRERRRARREERRQRRRRCSRLRRCVPTWRMSLAALGTLFVLVTGLLVAGYLLVEIPAANADATAQSNVYLYADGTPLARDGDINRENIRLSDVPAHVRHAVLAAEDRDFYSEPGVDPAAMLRAAWNTFTGKGRQSGSTITQQYVKNYYLDQEQTLTRKGKELFIAVKLNREQRKSDILQGYLNTSYFGRNTYGIQAAAQAYYGVDAADLSPAQGAYLASLLNAPSAYDVVAHPENRSRALARWNYVLDGMVGEGWLGRAERARTRFPQPRPPRVQSSMSGQRGYVVQAVKHYLTEHGVFGDPDRPARGYRITTTLRRRPQEAFSQAVGAQLLSRLDRPDRPVDRTVRAGGVAIDPDTGKVVAMYGGIGYTKQFVNNATRRDYQVGSAFKPLVLAAALQNGANTQSGETITPNTVYDGTDRRPVQGWSGSRYAPQNEDNRSYGPLTLREATDKSVNAVYAQLAVDVGPGLVKRTAIRLGLPPDTPDMPAGPAIALGTATASPLDLAQAYATLANHGTKVPYTLVEKVTRDGRKVRLPRREPERVVSREAADTTTAVLRGVVEGGTGTAAQAAGRPAAGKTGTAEEDKAAWFAGYTPGLATVVSVMGQNPRSGAHTSLYGALGAARMNGGGPPAQIWAQFMAAVLNGPVRDFDLNLQPGAEESAAPQSMPPGVSEQPGGTDRGEDEGALYGTGGGGPVGGTGAGPEFGDGGTGLHGLPGAPGRRGVRTERHGDAEDDGKADGERAQDGTGEGTLGEGTVSGRGGARPSEPAPPGPRTAVPRSPGPHPPQDLSLPPGLRPPTGLQLPSGLRAPGTVPGRRPETSGGSPPAFHG